MTRLSLILAALTLVHSACLDLITVIPDDLRWSRRRPTRGRRYPTQA